MSLAIDVNEVSEVLLADGWHRIDKASPDPEAWYEFSLDAYEYVYEGQFYQDDKLPSIGFEFVSDGITYVGPISSIIAVKRVYDD